MRIPYPRPAKLSDPYSDFTPESLNGILATPDEELEWHHLRNVLGPFLPAGTYQECVYFLPLAFQSLLHGKQALDLTTAVSWFISEYADELAEDGLLDECRAGLESCLHHWTADFTVEHFDHDGCAAKGWRLRHFDYVHRSETVCETLCDLDRFTRHGDLADRFIARLASSDDPVASAWFLELACRRDDVYHPPVRKSFQSCFTDTGLLAQKQAIVEESLVPAVTSPTYWKDVFTKLDD